MRRALALLLLAGCGGPHSGPARALEEYEHGKRLIEEGQPLQAAERFRRAAEADPGHSLLVSWQAWALASGGQVEEAIALLLAAPGARLPEDLYNLGAWNARLGRDEEALASLTRAIAADPSLRARLADDPDLAALQGRLNGLHALGDEPLRAVMIGEEGAILAGESYDLELVVQGAAGRALALSWDQPLPAGFTLRRAVDEVVAGREGAGELRTLTWRVRAAAPGEGDLGPWTLTVGAEQQALPAVPWQVLLPEGVKPPAPGPAAGPDEAWWAPREALAGLAPPAAVWRHGALAVLYSPGDAVTLSPSPLAPPLEIELRRDEQAEALARVWVTPEGADAPTVHIARGGKVLLDQRVKRGN